MTGEPQERGTLKGIAATLLTLALLAERAAARSFPVRFLALAILYCGEAVARAFVARTSATLIAEAIEAGCPLPDFPDLACLDEPTGLHYGAADAVLLSLRLRVLAAMLGILAEIDGASDDWSSGWTADGSPGWFHRPGGALRERGGKVVTARRRGGDSRAARSRIRCHGPPCRDRPLWRRDWPRSIPLKRWA